MVGSLPLDRAELLRRSAETPPREIKHDNRECLAVQPANARVGQMLLIFNANVLVETTAALTESRTCCRNRWELLDSRGGALRNLLS